jgi:hypothetical protein
MIKKLLFATTSSLLVTACLTACTGYNLTSTHLQPKKLNLSAFDQLASNIDSLSTPKAQEQSESEETFANKQLISNIDQEINKKIYHSRHVVNSYKHKKEFNVKFSKKQLPSKAFVLSSDLSGYEINNAGFIELYAFNTEEITFYKFESVKLAATYENVINDEVILAQASTKSVETIASTDYSNAAEGNGPKDFKEADIVDEDVVMFDYSKNEQQTPVTKTINQKLYEQPLSSTVKNAITRELGKDGVVAHQMPKPVAMNTQKENIQSEALATQGIDLDSDENVIYDYSKPNAKKDQKIDKTIEEALNGFTSSDKTQVMNTQYSLKAREINLGTQKHRELLGFSFVPDYERSERSDDQSNGEIKFEYSLSGEMNTQTGIVEATGMINTRVELSLGSTPGMVIPLINEEGIQKFLKKRKISIEGNLILLSLDDSIQDTEVGSEYGQRFFFNKNFKLLSTNVGAAYVMYAGVRSGNVVISYFLSNKESAQKVIYVGEGEMYFDAPTFTRSGRETYTFMTRNLLAHKRKELVISGSDITFLDTNINAKKKALNAYEIKIPAMPSGMRKYFEFKHLKDSIIVGASVAGEIEIPGNDFIAKVLEVNQVSSLKDRCVIQINLADDIVNFIANGKNRSGEMFAETSFLDADGEFSHNSELASNAFVVGDMDGLINIRVDYSNGSTKFLKTFCKEGTYLVEQL